MSSSLVSEAPRSLLKAQYGVMMAGSSISLTVSATLATFIWRNSKEEGGRRLTTPYRRYLFAICICDIMQSSALLFGPISVPRDASETFFLARGNLYSCVIDGVVFLTGAQGVQYYVVVLCFSFLYKIKYNMKDKDFLKRYDKWIHTAFLTYATLVNIGLLVSKNIYATESGAFCYPHKAYPFGCDEDPEVYGECKRNEQGLLLSFLLVVVLTVVSFTCIIVTMVKLVNHVVSIGNITRKRFRKSIAMSNASNGLDDSTGRSTSGHNRRVSFMFSSENRRSRNESSEIDSEPRRRPTLKNIWSYFAKEGDLNSSMNASEIGESSHSANHNRRQSSALATFQSRGEKKARERERAITIQAMLYAGSFMFVYIWPFVGAIAFLCGAITTTKGYFINSILGYCIFPLGGLLNGIVYTRQKANIIRNVKGCSRIQSFMYVVANGGELPDDCKNIRHNRRLLNNQKDDAPRPNVFKRCLHSVKTWMWRTKFFKKREWSEQPSMEKESPLSLDQNPNNQSSKSLHPAETLETPVVGTKDKQEDESTNQTSLEDVPLPRGALSSGISLESEVEQNERLDCERLESGLSIVESIAEEDEDIVNDDTDFGLSHFESFIDR
ncbi:hypothetical protein CTEN210_00620 [Chaetoceros tenuissimus]|uniref:Uncharacterized protein n=1 Tax=Chaetoceros tenuissimus TaxID=426638 RepID=A0AAD3GYV8_9STRA|nr:hypothetical protein CTEN210_00620 [Chaetoceros tenuissimus]